MVELVKCLCGSDARIRCKGNMAWVECRKKCGRRTVYMHFEEDGEMITKEIARQAVIKLWNEDIIIRKNAQ